MLGTRFTMQAGFYPNVFLRAGIALVMPDAGEQAYIHDKYVNELLKDMFLPATRDRWLLREIIQRMKEREQVEAVVLAGTELPLILHQDSVADIPLLDTTKIHVEAVVAPLTRIRDAIVNFDGEEMASLLPSTFFPRWQAH